jgi:hypothetical protein
MVADLILLALLLLNALLGLKRGFFEMAGRLILLALSIAVTLLLLSPLTSLLAKSTLLAPWADKVSQHILQPLEQAATGIGTAIAGLNLPPFLAALMQSELPAAGGSVAQAHQAFSAVLFHFALNAVGFILIFILVALVIHFAARALTRTTDSVPVIGAVNHLGGLVVGLVYGLAEIAILLLLVGFSAPYLPDVAKLVADSRIAGYFYSINILHYLL